MSAKLPYLRIYPGDELQAPVSYCSMAAQGLWLRLRMIMHSCEPYGYLCPGTKVRTDWPVTPASNVTRDITPDVTRDITRDIGVTLAGHVRDIGRDRPADTMIARMCGLTVEELSDLVRELDEAQVTRYTVNKIMYCEELIQQANERKQWRKRKVRQRNLPFNREDACHADVTPDVTPMSRRYSYSSSYSSLSSARSKKNGKQSEAERREEANREAIEPGAKERHR